jgi:hypothetical protein
VTVGGSNYLWVAYAVVTLAIPAGLLIPFLVRPRSVVAGVVATVPVSFLLLVGMSMPPRSLPRLVIHLVAILCLAALLFRVIRGINEGRFQVLWIVPALPLGLIIGFLGAGLLGLHIVAQFCNWPPLGPGISSYLCSG